VPGCKGAGEGFRRREKEKKVGRGKEPNSTERLEIRGIKPTRDGDDRVSPSIGLENDKDENDGLDRRSGRRQIEAQHFA